jgi:hypothetical protein
MMPPTPAVNPANPEYAAIKVPKDFDRRARDLMSEPIELVQVNVFVYMPRPRRHSRTHASDLLCGFSRTHFQVPILHGPTCSSN